VYVCMYVCMYGWVDGKHIVYKIEFVITSLRFHIVICPTYGGATSRSLKNHNKTICPFSVSGAMSV